MSRILGRIDISIYSSRCGVWTEKYELSVATNRYVLGAQAGVLIVSTKGEKGARKGAREGIRHAPGAQAAAGGGSCGRNFRTKNGRVSLKLGPPNYVIATCVAQCGNWLD